jgi:hypothetical protein
MTLEESLTRKCRAEDIKGPFKVDNFLHEHLSDIEVQNLPNFVQIRTAVQGLSGNISTSRVTEVLNTISDDVCSTFRSVVFIDFY